MPLIDMNVFFVAFFFLINLWVFIFSYSIVNQKSFCYYQYHHISTTGGKKRITTTILSRSGSSPVNILICSIDEKGKTVYEAGLRVWYSNSTPVSATGFGTRTWENNLALLYPSILWSWFNVFLTQRIFVKGKGIKFAILKTAREIVFPVHSNAVLQANSKVR